MNFTEEKRENAITGLSAQKTVFLIGDSSCMGYREFVAKELSGIANVVYPEENCRSSQYVIIGLRGWSGLCDPQKVDVVQFNTGHWDIAHWNDEPISLTSIEEYCRNMVRIADSLGKIYPNAKIVFATTMPMNPNGENSVNYRYTSEIKAYNEAAKKALAGKVILNDLFPIADQFTSGQYLDYCHLTDEGNALIGKHCAELFKSLL